MAGHGDGNGFLRALASLKPSNQNHAALLVGSNEILSLPEDALAEAALGRSKKGVSLLRLEHKPQTCFTMRLAGQPALP